MKKVLEITKKKKKLWRKPVRLISCHVQVIKSIKIHLSLVVENLCDKTFEKTSEHDSPHLFPSKFLKNPQIYIFDTLNTHAF